MTNLRDHLQELAEAAARDGRTAGPAAAIRRGRQRRRRLTAGTAALLAAVLAAGAVGTGQLRLSNRQEAPAAPSTKPRFPAKLADYAATVANGSAEAAVLGMLTDPDPRSEGLGACKGGRPTDVRIIAVGRLPDRQGVWMIAARPPLPNERRLCWMFAYGNQHRISSPVAYAGEPPLLTTLHANSGGDPSKVVVDGYVTKQAARVRLIRAGGRPPLELAPLQGGNDFPVNFFVAVIPWSAGQEPYPFERLIALDNSGREIASCWQGRRDASGCGAAG
jgi:hypothetical protein